MMTNRTILTGIGVVAILGILFVLLTVAIQMYQINDVVQKMKVEIDKCELNLPRSKTCRIVFEAIPIEK